MRRSEHLYRTLLHVLPNAVVVIDSVGHVDFSSPAARVMFRLPASNAASQPLDAFVCPEQRDAVREQLGHVLAHGGVIRQEYTLIRRTGERFPAETTATRWSSPENSAFGVVVVIRDLTEEKFRETTLRASEARFATMFISNPIGTLLTRFDNGLIVDANDALLRICGHSRDEVVGHTVFDLGLWVNADQREAFLRHASATGRKDNIESRVRHRSGVEVDVLASFELIDLGGESFVLSMLSDVSQRKRTESELRQSEERFRDMVEAISQVYWVFEPEAKRITYVSPAFDRVWGRSRTSLDELLEVWVASLHPEDRDRVVAAFNAAPAAFDETYRILRPDGTVRWIRAKSYGGGRSGSPRVIGVCTDITEEKALERQLLQAQRLEAVGTLASGVAHDINNILAPMLIIPRLLQPKLAEAHDQELLAMMHDNARRGADIVKQLLAFSREGDARRTSLHLHPLVKQMVAMMRETFPREISIQLTIDPAAPTIRANPTRVHQVLMNLCVNARDAMPGGGVLRISVRREVCDEPHKLHPDARPGTYAAIFVSDTGHGIPDEIMDRIFDPFFTTKEHGHGTGLGLSTVLGIVKSKGGFVTVESAVGKGSVFGIHIPAEAAAVCEVAAPAEAAASGAGELVLVVDDEPAVRSTLQMYLKAHGYHVAVAHDGAEAIRILQTEANSIRVLLTDLMMPGASGLEVIREARRRRLDMPVVVITGIPDDATVGKLSDLGVHDVLMKPFTAEAVSAAIRRSLVQSQRAA